VKRTIASRRSWIFANKADFCSVDRFGFEGSRDNLWDDVRIRIWTTLYLLFELLEIDGEFADHDGEERLL
jgi:hypothetical protein